MGKMAHQTGGAISGLKSGGKTTGNTGGSMAVHQDSRGSKKSYQGGSADVKALGRAAGGRIDKRGK